MTAESDLVDRLLELDLEPITRDLLRASYGRVAVAYFDELRAVGVEAHTAVERAKAQAQAMEDARATLEAEDAER